MVLLFCLNRVISGNLLQDSNCITRQTTSGEIGRYIQTLIHEVRQSEAITSTMDIPMRYLIVFKKALQKRTQQCLAAIANTLKQSNSFNSVRHKNKGHKFPEPVYEFRISFSTVKQKPLKKRASAIGAPTNFDFCSDKQIGVCIAIDAIPAIQKPIINCDERRYTRIYRAIQNCAFGFQQRIDITDLIGSTGNFNFVRKNSGDQRLYTVIIQAFVACSVKPIDGIPIAFELYFFKQTTQQVSRSRNRAVALFCRCKTCVAIRSIVPQETLTCPFKRISG